MKLLDAVDGERLVRTFLELVAIDSPTGHEERIGKELESRFSALGCQVTKDEIGNLVAVLPGTRDDTLMISTHMDTAGTDTGISPIIDDGVIRTDGSTILGADDKSGIAGCLELLTLLQEHPGTPHPTIEFVITVGEERGLVGSRHMDVSRLRATRGFVFDTAGVSGAITYWAPTSVYLTVTVHGKKVHAGVEPEKGINAVKVAAEAIAAMPLGARGRREEPDPRIRRERRSLRDRADDPGAGLAPGASRRGRRVGRVGDASCAGMPLREETRHEHGHIGLRALPGRSQDDDGPRRHLPGGSAR